ncbi:hypothetical protein HZC53_00640 [Candidatus Uhrbacteria bacterium]|nr:hypothetical protein [Candidatus Uhrbacteria bacterium]
MNRKYTRQELKDLGPTGLYKLGKDELKIPGLASMSDEEIANTVVAHLDAKGLLLQDAAPQTAAATAAVPIPAEVNVSYPPYETSGNYAGKSLAEIYDQLREPWSMANNVRCFINGQTANISHATMLKAGDRVEFGKPAGEKGD